MRRSDVRALLCLSPSPPPSTYILYTQTVQSTPILNLYKKTPPPPSTHVTPFPAPTLACGDLDIETTFKLPVVYHRLPLTATLEAHPTVKNNVINSRITQKLLTKISLNFTGIAISIFGRERSTNDYPLYLIIVVKSIAYHRRYPNVPAHGT